MASVHIHRSAFGGSGDMNVGQALRVKLKADAQNPEKLMVSQVIQQTTPAEPAENGEEPPSKRQRM